MSSQPLKLFGVAIGSALLFAAAPVQAQTVLKIGHVLAKGSHYDVGANKFCEEIEKGTAGRYKCQVFPASALGGEREEIELEALGPEVALSRLQAFPNKRHAIMFEDGKKIADLTFLEGYWQVAN